MVQFDAENALIGVNPHFGGKSKVRVLLVDHLESGTPLDGRFHGWADPEKAEAEKSGRITRSCSMLLMRPAIPNCRSLPRSMFKSRRSPTTFQVYPSSKAYEASQTGDRWHTSQQFIPSGLMNSGNDGMRAEAAFTGLVQPTAMRKNQLTGSEFVWCLVTSTGGSFDIVADPEILPKLPPVGGVVSGTFWLTGRIGASPKTPPTHRFRRLATARQNRPRVRPKLAMDIDLRVQAELTLKWPHLPPNSRGGRSRGSA